MFVAASVGASYFNAEREAGLRAFLTPTVLHFSALLTLCVLMAAPSHSTRSLSVLLLAAAVVGIAYSVRVFFNMLRGGFLGLIDWVDRLWYVVAPVVSYLLLMAVALLLQQHGDWALDLLALTMVLLLLGIRNAWDMTVFLVIKAPNAPNA